MITVERLVQQVRPGKWADLEEIDKKFDVVESRFGFPPKKRYQCLAGGCDINVLVVERQWDSLAASEAAYEKALADAEYQQLLAAMAPIVKATQRELYMPLL
jgi:hypothetical protein